AVLIGAAACGDRHDRADGRRPRSDTAVRCGTRRPCETCGRSRAPPDGGRVHPHRPRDRVPPEHRRRVPVRPVAVPLAARTHRYRRAHPDAAGADVSTRRGVFWPLLLIALGLIFLLQNFGVISGVSWLAVASLWPLLLILIGLDIAFARRWPLPTLAVEVAVIAAGLALVAYSPNLSPGVFVFGEGAAGTGESDVAV